MAAEGLPAQLACRLLPVAQSGLLRMAIAAAVAGAEGPRWHALNPSPQVSGKQQIQRHGTRASSPAASSKIALGGSARLH
jgi:hypothetical protein